jgi:DNA-binding response OmpR family regulator
MKKKIVLIEDDQILLKALNMELLKQGYEILSSIDGQNGLALVKKEMPDLIILDLVLPKMHGFNVLEMLKVDANTRKIPVIILSNLGQIDDVKKGIKLGAEDYYIKASTDLSDLSKKIKKLLA